MIPSFLNSTEADVSKLLESRGWSLIRPSAFNMLIGPLWSNQEGGHHRCGFVVRDKHDNSAGRAHGGMIMAFGDEALGVTASATRPGEQLFTITFECQFIGGAKLGDFVEIECEIIRQTKSLIFMRGTCFVGDNVIATCGGVWKVSGPRH